MKRKDNRPQVLLIGQQDFIHKLWKQIFPNFGLHLYKIMPPQPGLNWSELENADVIIIPLEDDGSGFSECELLQKALSLYPGKIIIGETDDYSAVFSEKAKAMGAHGYIHRDELEEVLGEALIKIVNGERFYMGLPGHMSE